MGRRKKYIDYDYDQVFDESIDNLEESRILDALNKRDITSVYATKTVKSGNQLEVEVYPEFTKKKAITKDGRFSKRKDIQNNLNNKNAKKTLIRLINTNFTDKDYFLTLTFSKEPKDEDEAMKHVKNYLKCVNRLRKKKGLENAKYIFVVESRNENGSKVRTHVHMLIEQGLTMDELEGKWKHGRRNQCRRLDPTKEDGLSGLANYLVKAPKASKYKKKWVSSRNLKKPVIRKNHQDFSNKKVKKMVEDISSIPAVMTKKFKAEFKNVEIRYNSYNNKWYLYVKMYFKE